MKAKIRKTGEIINIAEYAKIELDVCDSYGNPISVRSEDVELISDVREDNFPKINWEQRRYEIAKNILPYTAKTSREVLMSGYSLGKDAEGKTFEEYCAFFAISLADALIEELKKGVEQ